MPARVLLQDFTGVPAVVDLAAMRDAMRAMGGDPARINPLQPADLVIDHSVQVDVFGTPDALRRNTEIEFERNRERYAFLRWGQQAFGNFRVVPPDTGIVHQVNLEYLAPVESYARAQGLFRTADTPDPVFSDRLELDLGTVEPSLAGPRRPQDRVPLRGARGAWRKALAEFLKKEVDGLDKREVERWLAEGGQPIATGPPAPTTLGDLARTVPIEMGGARGQLGHGAVVIAALTSCTNTSNPSVMLAAGLLARKAVARGLRVRPWVKTSLAPGSKVVTRYLADSKRTADLERLGFHLVGYGCTTCVAAGTPVLLANGTSRRIE